MVAIGNFCLNEKFINFLIPNFLILFAAVRNRNFLDCKLTAPISFFRGFGTRFCVH